MPIKHRQPANRQTLGVRQIDLESVQTASSELAREINRDIILELIRSNQPVTRADLSRVSGLRPSTVSSIVDQLLREKWIEEGALIKPARGRPSTVLSLNSNLMCFALDIRPNRMILAIVDLTGRFVTRETIGMPTDIRKTVALVGKRIRQLREQYSGMTFEGIGVSVPGRVHPVTQQILFAPNMDWHDFDLKVALERVSSLTVEIDNDANVCLISELWSGRLRGIRNVVLIAVGEGIGASILSNGQMHSGNNGLAGEFGHLLVDSSGPRCECGGKGCWEVMASSRAAVRNFNQMSRRKVNDIFELQRLCHDGDISAIRALAEQARAIGHGLRLITGSLSPELILVVGDMTSVWDRYGDTVAQELASSMLSGPPPVIRTAGDAELARLSGSAAMLMQRHVRYHLSTHERPAEA